MINFIRVLGPGHQVRVELSWVAKLVEVEVEADAIRIGRGTYLLPTWLIEIRSVAVDAGLLTIWQQVVDDLVVAGVTRLARYSD